MEETIKKIEAIIRHKEERLEETTLPKDEKEEISLYSSIRYLRKAIDEIKFYYDDTLG